MQTRFDVSSTSMTADFEERARAALDVLSLRPGFVRGRLGRAADEPSVWLLTTEWDSVGSYRRSLSSYDVKLVATTLLAEGRDEPSAFEVVHAVDTPQPPAARPSQRAK
ncbi:MAG: Antibiotic biosynthesis monooxygenase [Frankiales bacterium]|nr:Antibiotic biosynthesis monooxygenase [Frankiales bacterium]